jgi:hypothetical protein
MTAHQFQAHPDQRRGDHERQLRSMHGHPRQSDKNRQIHA